MNNKNSSSGQLSHVTNSTSSPSPNKRLAFKMVRSTFQPPQQTQASYNYLSDQKSSELGRKAKKTMGKQYQVDSQSIHSLHNNNNFNPSIEFISSLIPIKQLTYFDEGDCIPVDSDDRWLIVSGEIKVNGHNGCAFVKKQGYVFFASRQTKRKIKQVVVMSSTSAFRIPQSIFKQSIRNYLYVKNSQKIKFLQYCPFLAWNQSLSQDISIAMQYFQPDGKDVMIYKQGDESQYIYFVKQGIVLLERTGKAGNQVILDFQRHYQTSYLNQQQGLIIVRKGMLFGADGILIKQINTQLNLLANSNPQDPLPQNIRPYEQQKQLQKLKSTRIYNAKSIGKCQLYRIHKSVLQTFLKTYVHHTQKSNEGQAHISNKQLDRICLQYTNLLMGSKQGTKEVSKKNFQFKISMDESIVQEIQKKKKKVQQMKMHQKKIKKVSHNTSQQKKNQIPKFKQVEQFPLVRSPATKSKSKKAQSESRNKDISLPSLNKKYVQNLIFKKLQAQQAQRYIGYKKKIETALLGKQKQQQKNTQKEAGDNKNMKNSESLHFINVKSYRSIVSSLG